MSYPVIVPALWLLVGLYRAIRGRSASSSPAGGKGGAPAQTRPGFWIALYLSFVTFPLALVGAALAADGLDSGYAAAVGFGLSLVLLFQGPHWLAWRVLAPRGWLRTAKVWIWVAFYTEPGGRQGACQLLEAAYTPKWRPGPGKVTAWNALALAVRAEREGASATAELMLATIHQSGRPPRGALRARILELMIWPAVTRGDWREVRRRLEPARGRGARWLRHLAEAHLGAPPPASRLWLSWALAPGRRRSFPYLREALAVREEAASGSFPAAPETPSGEETGATPWLRHLRLLAEGAAGRPVRTADLEALAAEWEEVLEGPGHARLLARGLELGAQGVAQAVAGLRETVVDELAALANVAQGAWSEDAASPLAERLRSRQVAGLLEILEREQEGFPETGGVARAFDPPLVELERWFRFRGGVEKLVEAGGPDELLTAWFNGLRYAACNWPVFLGRAHPVHAVWACREMHRWSASLACELGDDRIFDLSSKNAARLK